MSKPTEETRQLGVRVPKRLIKQLRRIALDEEKFFGEILVEVLEEFVNKKLATK